VNSQQTTLKIEMSTKSISSLQDELHELERRSKLLDDDMLDMNTIELEMIKVFESESVSLPTIIEKIYMKNQDKYNARKQN
jgi:hypothetical protein